MTDEDVPGWKPIFVFGSNLAGRHGKGAALHALNHEGAKYGQAAGFQGTSYAIPTKDKDLKPLPLEDIQMWVHLFLEDARSHPHLTFTVTKIGCGLAGYSEDDIKPMFKNAPVNCILPEGWRE